jgi:hypothetical protein
MNYIKNFSFYLALAGLAGCTSMEPTQRSDVETPHEVVVVRVPVFVMPNCDLPRQATCQWIVPPSRGAGQRPLIAPAAVKGIAL